MTATPPCAICARRSSPSTARTSGPTITIQRRPLDRQRLLVEVLRPVLLAPLQAPHLHLVILRHRRLRRVDLVGERDLRRLLPHLEADRQVGGFARIADAVEPNLEKRDRRQAELVKLRFFAGLTIEEAAEALGVSTSTAENDWAHARCWLRLEMDAGRRATRPDRAGRADFVGEFARTFRTEIIGELRPTPEGVSWARRSLTRSPFSTPHAGSSRRRPAGCT